MRLAGRARLGALALAIAVTGGGAGCYGAAQVLQTPHYNLAYPGYWKVKKVGAKDGEATLINVPPYGDAVIDEGSGALGPKSQNYEAVQADVEVRLYGWPAPASVQNPTWEVSQRLQGDRELDLSSLSVVLEVPPECGIQVRRKYQIFGEPQAPLDLVRRQAWRTVVVGGASGGVLLGAAGRVQFEQDIGRYCHNLRNLQIQLQTALDGVSIAQPAAAPKPVQ